jgi:hypothetical protein
MVAVVFSLFLVWKRVVFDASSTLAMPVMYKHTVVVDRTGFGTAARWPLIICAILDCSMLLFPPQTAGILIGILQCACAGACLIITLTNFALLPGVLLCAVGAVLLAVGAVDRLMSAMAQASSSR